MLKHFVSPPMVIACNKIHGGQPPEHMFTGRVEQNLATMKSAAGMGIHVPSFGVLTPEFTKKAATSGRKVSKKLRKAMAEALMCAEWGFRDRGVRFGWMGRADVYQFSQRVTARLSTSIPTMSGVLPDIVGIGLSRSIVNDVNSYSVKTLSYRRAVRDYCDLIASFAVNLHGVDLDKVKNIVRVYANPTSVDPGGGVYIDNVEVDSLGNLMNALEIAYEQWVGHPFPQNHYTQLSEAVIGLAKVNQSDRVKDYRDEWGIPHDSPTSIVLHFTPSEEMSVYYPPTRISEHVGYGVLFNNVTLTPDNLSTVFGRFANCLHPGSLLGMPPEYVELSRKAVPYKCTNLIPLLVRALDCFRGERGLGHIPFFYSSDSRLVYPWGGNMLYFW